MFLEIWAAFRHLFTGGPTGREYLRAFDNDLENYQAVWALSSIMFDLSYIGCDILMVSKPPWPQRRRFEELINVLISYGDATSCGKAIDGLSLPLY